MALRPHGHDRTSFRTWLVLGALVATTVLAVSPATAEQAVGTTWSHGQGELLKGSKVVRLIEAWVAPDGRYRVVSRDPAGRITEDVAWDGETQIAWVSTEGAPAQPLLGESASHYAIDVQTPTQARPVAFDLALTKDFDRELPASWLRTYTDGSTVGLNITWKWGTPDAGTLARIAYVADVASSAAVMQIPDAESGPVVQRTTGTSSTVFYSQGAPGACVYAYSFRNTSDGYYRATSQYRGNCYYMWVTLWGGSQVTNDGSCLTSYWLGSGPYRAAQISSKYVYTSAADTCSNHFGWSWDWLYWVEFAGLDAGA